MRFDANLAFLFKDRPILERFQAAREAGFSGVELWSCENATPEEVAAAATSAGIEIVCVNASVGDLRAGGAGLSGVPGREREFEDAIHAAVAVARTLRCKQVNVGPCRLVSDGQRSAALATLARNLAFAAEELGHLGIRALVEPVNAIDVPGVLLQRVGDAVDVIARAEHPNVGLLFDIYHITQIDPSPLRCLEQHFASIGHIQIADVPGRGAPGTGRIDFLEFFEKLEQLEYSGWIGAEYQPGEPQHSTHAWLRQRTQRSGS
jgi:hydroxypyruvate isomerase